MTIDKKSVERKAKALDIDGDKTITLDEILKANQDGDKFSYNEFKNIKEEPEKIKKEISSAYKDAGYSFEESTFDELHNLAINGKLPHKTEVDSKPKQISIS